MAPWSSVAAFAMTCPTPRFLSAIVAKMLASIALLMATIAYSNSPAPTDRSAFSSVASSWTAWVTSGAMSLTIASPSSIASTSFPRRSSSRAAAAPNRPRPTTSTDDFMATPLPDGGSSDAHRLDCRARADRLVARGKGEDERERSEPTHEHRDGRDEAGRIREGRGETGRGTDSPERRDRFEHHLDERRPRGGELQQKADGEGDRDRQEGDRQRAVDEDVRDPATERSRGRQAARRRDDGHEQDAERVHLDAPGRRA